MDWSEIVLAEAKGPLTFADLNDLIPSKVAEEDIEKLLQALNDAGVWISDE